MSIQNADVRNLPARKRNEPVGMRAVPFGPPPTRDNWDWNPGRQRFAANNGNGYGSIEGRQFLFLNTFQSLNKRSFWRSGPCSNNKTNDHFVAGAGFWTHPAGTNCDWENYAGAGNPHKITGFSVKNARGDDKNGIYLFDIAHGTNTSSDPEGAEYGCIGFSAHMMPDHDENLDGSLASIGLRHAYAMYRSDTTEEDVQDIKDRGTELLETLQKLADLIDSIVPPEVQNTFGTDEYDDTFTENVSETALLEEFLKRDIYNTFSSNTIQDSDNVGALFQIMAEIILNKQGKDVAEAATILNEIKAKSSGDGSIDGIDVFDFLLKLCTLDDEFIQKNPDLFSLRNIFAPLSEIDPDEIQTQGAKDFVASCFLNGGTPRKEDGSGEITCSYEDQFEELEMVGPVGPYTTSVYTSSDEFKNWCRNNKGTLSSGTNKSCDIPGISPVFREEDYESGIDTFMLWCEEGGGKSHFFERNAEVPVDSSVCEITVTTNNQPTFKEWCDMNGVYHESSSNPYCDLKGSSIPFTKSEYEKDVNGFVTWCTKSDGDASYDDRTDIATCKIITASYDQDEYFSAWCSTNEGQIASTASGNVCRFPDLISFSQADFYNYPEGFQNWCKINDGDEYYNQQDGTFGCHILGSALYKSFDNWCAENNGTVQIVNNLKECVFEGAETYSEANYTDSSTEFIFWCEVLNEGKYRAPTIAVDNVKTHRCDITFTQDSQTNVDIFCDVNNGTYNASRNSCKIDFLPVEYNASYMDRKQQGFIDWCKDNDGTASFWSDNSLKCVVSSVSTRTPFKEWVETNYGSI